MKILVFTEGTSIMHSSEEKMKDFSSYIPTKGSVEKINSWKQKGAKICFMTSRTTPEEVQQVKNVLKKYGFPESELFFRKHGEDYIDVIKRVNPDILIDDDCECINFFDTSEPRINEGMNIKAITIKEFAGLENLPDNPNELYNAKSIIETYKIPQGRMFIVKSDKNISAGFLELNPHQELPKHNRHIKEELKQAQGTCIIRLFNTELKEVTIKKEDELEIPANQFHIHSNPTDEKSLTFWLFRGDITEIIQELF